MHELCLNLFQYSPMFGPGAPPLERTLAGARQAGFSLVGLDVFTLDAAGLAPGELRRLLERHDLRCFEVLGLSVDASDDDALEGARRAAAWVGEAGAEWVLTVVGAPVDDAVIDRFGRCADVVVAEGGRLALEFLPYMAVNTIASARGVCDAVGADRAGVLVDSWHVFRGTDTVAGVAAMPADAIAYVQFDDALPLVGPVADEVMTRRTWPGTGEFPLEDFAGAVRSTGYTGPISVELLNASWRDEGLDPAEFAPRGGAHQRQLFPHDLTRAPILVASARRSRGWVRGRRAAVPSSLGCEARKKKPRVSFFRRSLAGSPSVTLSGLRRGSYARIPAESRGILRLPGRIRSLNPPAAPSDSLAQSSGCLVGFARSFLGLPGRVRSLIPPCTSSR